MTLPPFATTKGGNRVWDDVEAALDAGYGYDEMMAFMRDCCNECITRRANRDTEAVSAWRPR